MSNAVFGLIFIVFGAIVMATAPKIDAGNKAARDLEKGTGSWVDGWARLFPFTDVAGTARGVAAIRFAGAGIVLMGVILLLVGLAS